MSQIVYLSGEPIVHGYSFAGGGKLPPCPSQGLMFKHPFRYDDTGVEKDQKWDHGLQRIFVSILIVSFQTGIILWVCVQSVELHFSQAVAWNPSLHMASKTNAWWRNLPQRSNPDKEASRCCEKIAKEIRKDARVVPRYHNVTIRSRTWFTEQKKVGAYDIRSKISFRSAEQG